MSKHYHLVSNGRDYRTSYGFVSVLYCCINVVFMRDSVRTTRILLGVVGSHALG